MGMDRKSSRWTFKRGAGRLEQKWLMWDDCQGRQLDLVTWEIALEGDRRRSEDLKSQQPRCSLASLEK